MFQSIIKKLLKLDKLKPCIIKFKKNNIIKIKIYTFDYVVKRGNECLIIIIFYDNCIFFINSKILKNLDLKKKIVF